jgi:dihydrolipoyl dehydrogenase
MHLGDKADLNVLNKGVQVCAGNKEVMIDCVLAALGRRPNIENLGLESLGVTLDQHGIPPINPSTMQVSDLPIIYGW